MEDSGRIISEIRSEIKELKEFNREQKEINKRLEGHVEEQRETNREQKAINRGLTRLFMQSEKRFQNFYRLIVSLQQRRG